jgi:putative acetyltransferase
MPRMRIRTAVPEDAAGIRAVNVSAFGTTAEADLVEALCERAAPIISLVADADGVIVGHILFTPMTLDADRELKVMGLAPMAVATGRQRQGIGGALVRAGLDECWHLGAAAVAVLGHAEYYPRFGFAPASKLGLMSQYDVPDDVFMIVEGRPGALAGKHGLLSYHPAFAEFSL